MVDAAGNVYITGGYSGSATFGSTTLTGNGIYVAKLAASGTYQWATGGGDAVITDLVVDGGGGNVVVSGWFNRPTIQLGAITLAGSSTATYVTNDGFVARLTPAGAWEWALTTAGGTTAEAVGVDGAGNVCLTGTLDGTARFGATIITSAGAADGFVAKLTPAGAWMWAVGIGRAGYDYGLALAVDPAGSVYVSGFFEGDSVQFGATTLANTTRDGATEEFVAKLSPAGA